MKKNILCMLACLGFAGVICGDASAMAVRDKLQQNLPDGFTDAVKKVVGDLNGEKKLSADTVDNFDSLVAFSKLFGADGRISDDSFRMDKGEDTTVIRIRKFVKAVKMDDLLSVKLKGAQAQDQDTSIFNGVHYLRGNEIGKLFANGMAIIRSYMSEYREERETSETKKARAKAVLDFLTKLDSEKPVDELAPAGTKWKDRLGQLAKQKVTYRKKENTLLDIRKTIFGKANYDPQRAEKYASDLKTHIEALNKVVTGFNPFDQEAKLQNVLVAARGYLKNPDNFLKKGTDNGKWGFPEGVIWEDNHAVTAESVGQHAPLLTRNGSIADGEDRGTLMNMDSVSSFVKKLVINYILLAVFDNGDSLPLPSEIADLPLEDSTVGQKVSEVIASITPTMKSGDKTYLECKGAVEGVAAKVEAACKAFGTSAAIQKLDEVNLDSEDDKTVEAGLITLSTSLNDVSGVQKATPESLNPVQLEQEDTIVLNKMLLDFADVFTPALQGFVDKLGANYMALEALFLQLKSDKRVPATFNIALSSQKEVEATLKSLAEVYPKVFDDVVNKLAGVEFEPLNKAVELYNTGDKFGGISAIASAIAGFNDAFKANKTALSNLQLADAMNASKIGVSKNLRSSLESWGLQASPDGKKLTLSAPETLKAKARIKEGTGVTVESITEAIAQNPDLTGQILEIESVKAKIKPAVSKKDGNINNAQEGAAEKMLAEIKAFLNKMNSEPNTTLTAQDFAGAFGIELD